MRILKARSRALIICLIPVFAFVAGRAAALRMRRADSPPSQFCQSPEAERKYSWIYGPPQKSKYPADLSWPWIVLPKARRLRALPRPKNPHSVDPKITVSIQKMPLIEALRRVAKQAGFGFHTDAFAEGLEHCWDLEVSVEFKDTPLSKVMGRLLWGWYLDYEIDRGLLIIRDNYDFLGPKTVEFHNIHGLVAKSGAGLSAGRLLAFCYRALRVDGLIGLGGLEVSGTVLVCRGPEEAQRSLARLLQYLRNPQPGQRFVPHWIEAIQEKLESKTVTMNRKHCSLRVALRDFHEQTGLPLCTRSCDQYDGLLDKPVVSANFDNVKASRALDLLLRPQGLTWEMSDLKLNIVELAEAYPYAAFEIIDVSDFVDFNGRPLNQYGLDQLLCLIEGSMGDEAWTAPHSLDAGNGRLYIFQRSGQWKRLYDILTRLRELRWQAEPGDYDFEDESEVPSEGR